jgi:hypothetical protein
MSTFSKPFSAGSTSIRRRCANGAKRSSIPSVQSRPNGSNTLLDEDAAAGCLRDGTTRFGLQPHPRNEPHGRPAAHGSDQSIVRPEKAAGTHSRRPPKSTFLLIPERFYTAKTHLGRDRHDNRVRPAQKALSRPSSMRWRRMRVGGWQISHAFQENDTDPLLCGRVHLAGRRRLCKFGEGFHRGRWACAASRWCSLRC